MRALIPLLPAIALLAGCIAADDPPGGPTAPGADALRFGDPVALECPARIQYAQECDAFGEPQLEVQGDGTIWYSSVCCIGQSPPLWRSFDGGVTFEPMESAQGAGAARDAFGIEGDLAVDEAGNVYFFDISLATAYLTKFAPDGTHLHTKPDAFPPLVDRPWVRAGQADEVHIVYNQGPTSWYYRSQDGGMTWDLAGGKMFPCSLAGLGQGGSHDHLLVTACSPRRVWQSHDGGRTWDDGPRAQPEGVELAGAGPVPPAYADDAGTAWIPLVVAQPEGRSAVAVIGMGGGSAGAATVVSPAGMVVAYPWLAAGRDGHVAVAYYASTNGTRDDQQDAEWRLHVSFTTDAGADAPLWTTVAADRDVLHRGTLARELGDFLQLRHAEDGDLVVAYAKRTTDGLESRFVRSDGIDLGHARFLNGPLPA